MFDNRLLLQTYIDYLIIESSLGLSDFVHSGLIPNNLL